MTATLSINTQRKAASKSLLSRLLPSQDDFDKPGPAPRKTMVLSEQIRSELEEQRRARVIAKIAEMTSELHTVFAQCQQKRIQRRRSRFQTAPSHLVRDAQRQQEQQQQQERPRSADEEPGRPVIIFDWDDTLLPTWFITEVISASRPADEKYSRLPEDSPFFQPLMQHALLVSQTLATAAANASVAIVTLAARPWVENSAEWFLPGLDLQEILFNLDIPVFYAREHVLPAERRAAHVEEGVDLYMIAKRNAMKCCLRRLPGCPSRGANIICIGDSNTEELAIKDILWSDDSGSHLCKTIKLLDDPTLEVLSMELQLVTSWFDKMVGFTDDFHICLNDAGNKLVWDD